MKKIPLNLLRCVIIVALSLLSFTLNAADKSDKIKPRWITSLPKPKSNDYSFVLAQGHGVSLDDARRMAFINLTSKLEHERNIVINNTYKGSVNYSTETGSSENESFSLEAIEKGKEINLTCRVIDEYWEHERNQYLVTALYTVTDSNKPLSSSYSDEISLKSSYGVLPMVYSLIPGVGQFYKGNYVKGGMFMGGTVAGAVISIFCENQRADYAKKMKEKPQNFDFYRNKKARWTTGRNVALGATTAIYVYNLIDALVAPGGRRVVIKNRSYNYSLCPVITECSTGVELSFNF